MIKDLIEKLFSEYSESEEGKEAYSRKKAEAVREYFYEGFILSHKADTWAAWKKAPVPEDGKIRAVVSITMQDGKYHIALTPCDRKSIGALQGEPYVYTELPPVPKKEAENA